MKERALESAKKVGFWAKILRERNKYKADLEELKERIKGKYFDNWYDTIVKANNQLDELELLKTENAKLRKDLKDERNKEK